MQKSHIAFLAGSVSENEFSEKFVQIEIVSGWDHTITTMAAGKGGVRKEEIQQ
jgi:hypothetical protein